ncbi:MAG: DUF2147 domain-containing protein [Alphaproteobacteria bacterium]|nr:DUF2147 domain-containing protein [Alphaproteobacteria bacterium]MBV9062569.1 DUF2147 domain-containing protein [Alphaproteobacteria bacterium]
MRPADLWPWCALGVLLGPSLSAAASDIAGLWDTQKNHGRVLIEHCGSEICGRVLDGDQLRADADQRDVHNPDPAKRGRRVKGLWILHGYSGGPREWREGTIYDPQTGDESERSTLTLISEGVLKVRGCRLLFCRSETWTRER